MIGYTRCTIARLGQWFFFFQAEDGIRDYKVTGVQTCALPILRHVLSREAREDDAGIQVRNVADDELSIAGEACLPFFRAEGHVLDGLCGRAGGDRKSVV